MDDFWVQLIPNLISLQTNVKKINCFSFWDKKENRNFFDFNPSSEFDFKYFVKSEVPDVPKEIEFRFSNFIFSKGKWYFKRKVGTLDLSFVIDEINHIVIANKLCHNLFVKVSWIEPIGYILSDYINYQIEKKGISYHDGAAAAIKGRTFLIFGFGKNFKTTLVNMILRDGGYYIGEEFFLLNNDRVYATIPNSHRFDFRESHKQLMKINLREKKCDSSIYDAAIFLIFSNKDEVVELDFDQANSYAEVFHQYIANSFFYSFLKAKDFLEKRRVMEKRNLLLNKKARFFIIYFTDVKNALKFISEY